MGRQQKYQKMDGFNGSVNILLIIHIHIYAEIHIHPFIYAEMRGCCGVFFYSRTSCLTIIYLFNARNSASGYDSAFL